MGLGPLQEQLVLLALQMLVFKSSSHFNKNIGECVNKYESVLASVSEQVSGKNLHTSVCLCVSAHVSVWEDECV